MKKTSLLILGANGNLGTLATRRFAAHGDIDVIACSHADLDITDEAALDSMLQARRPEFVLNATAFLNADNCERDPARSHAVNFKAPAALARLIAKRHPGSRLIHISTDFVFDGRDGRYTEGSPVRPLSYYGLHKLMADEAILSTLPAAHVLRVASVVGIAEGKRDFFKALLAAKAAGRDTIGVNAEYRISVSTIGLILDTISRIVEGGFPAGLVNTVASGETTWHDLARHAFAALGEPIVLEPQPASAYPTLAPRPANSTLSNSRLCGILGADVPDWQTLVSRQIDASRAAYRGTLSAAA